MSFQQKLGYNSLRPWKGSLGVCANDRTIKQKQIIKKKVVGKKKKDRREKKSNGRLFPLMIGICAAALGGAGRRAYFFKFWFHFSLLGNLCRLYFSSLLGWAVDRRWITMWRVYSLALPFCVCVFVSINVSPQCVPSPAPLIVCVLVGWSWWVFYRRDFPIFSVLDDHLIIVTRYRSSERHANMPERRRRTWKMFFLLRFVSFWFPCLISPPHGPTPNDKHAPIDFFPSPFF